MKKLSTLLLGCSTAILFLSVSCSKDDDPAPAQPTNTDNMAKSPWIFEKATANGLNVSAHPSLACYVDNSITFASNLSGTISEGALVCTPSAPSTFNWSFQSNETVLHMSFTLFAGGSPDFTIITLNQTNLILSQTISLSGVPATVQVTFKH